MATDGPNPSGLCLCGCGQKVALASKTSKRNGWVRGKPVKYLVGHQHRKSPHEYIIDTSTGCWEWQLTVNNKGYGVTAVDGKRVYAHRAYYERSHGPISPGLELDHLCRNPRCVNPRHLEPVTRAENQRRGIRPKLTTTIVASIKRQLASGVHHRQIAQLYAVDESTIRAIRDGRTWKDVAA